MKSAKPKGSDNKITLIDVAAVAGVSAITVSRALNQPDKVSAALREKVQKAVDALGYIPNQHASSLASARSRVIGVAIPSLSNIVFTDVLRGIYQVFDAAGYKVLMVDTHYSPMEEERMVRTLLSQSPEALIITGGDQTRACHSLLQKSRIPIVQLMELLDAPLDMNVGLSHYQAAFDMTGHLLQQGCSRIGFLGARMDPRAQQRLAGYKAALEQQGVYRKERVITTPAPSSIAMGGELLRSLLAEVSGDLDAVFCLNDDLALGALFEAQRMHIAVPGQLAICGFNDIEAAAFVNPSLTSVTVRRYEMGLAAAQMIVAALEGKPIAQKQLDMGYDIQVRQSSKRLK